MKHGSVITEVKTEGNGDFKINIKEECESFDHVKLEVKKEELSELSERNVGSSSTTPSIIRSATFIPDVLTLHQHMSRTYVPITQEITCALKIPTLIQLVTSACHEKERKMKIFGNMENVNGEPSFENLPNVTQTDTADNDKFAEPGQDTCQQKEHDIDTNKMATLTGSLEMHSPDEPHLYNDENRAYSNLVTESPAEDRKDDNEVDENGTVVHRSHAENQLEATNGNCSVIPHTDVVEVKQNEKAADTSTDSIYYDAQSKNFLKNTLKVEDINIDMSTQGENDVQSISKSLKKSSEILHCQSPSGSSPSSNEDEDNYMTYETEESGQYGCPAGPNESAHEGNGIPLLGSDDSIQTISTTAAVEATQVFDSDESLGNITQTTMKSSKNIDGLCAKATETESSAIDTLTLSSNLTSTSDYIQTFHPENTTYVGEASTKSSMKHFEDTMKPTKLEPIPLEGSVMVDCKHNPLTITISIGPKDSVATKLKQISTLATEYTTTVM